MTTDSQSPACWLHSSAELDEVLDRLGDQPLALDTEFERVSTFFPIPGLVQLGVGEDYYLVDPDVAAGSTRFRDTLADAGKTKILYAMSEDLELFRHWLDIEPAGLLDLQLGAALAGAGFSVGYARLVETLFGATLDKSATRSDWLARPLTPAQEQYALDDVRFLLPLYRWVTESLEARGLLPALAEETARFATDLAAQDNPQRYYLKIRGGWALTTSKQQVLQRLALWREQECRRRDRPRNRVVSDALLIAIADAMPARVGALNGIKDLPAPVVRRYGEQIVEMVNQPVAADGDFETIRPPLTREQQKLYKRVKACFVSAAETADVPIELLAPRKRLESLVQQGEVSGEWLSGWRGQLIEPVLSEIEAELQHD
ncbi:ribonuclease D [Marinobacter xestospongiae]|uniref:ribonuclease D n=1 Tax=Marinobacter xestospongiae TaxID=994319 RepID=UPI002003B181|nr:HRDC domain-containing protein [Marinobacter xestospongiae]MCK7566116.1 HRDC domain-containing protein [Marinobacter xestospongiae]